MKKLIPILCLFLAFLACSEDDQDNKTTPIQDLQMPSLDVPLIENQLVTIQGNGFSKTSEVWLRNLPTKSNEDIQAEVTNVDDKSLTFKVPANVSGKKEIILKQNENEYLLGMLTFKKKYKYYAFYEDNIKKELAEIDIETGEVRWNDLKIPGFGMDSRGYVFSENGDELVALNMDLGHPKIYRLNMTTKEVKTIKLKHDGYPNFHEIIRLNDKYYAFYDDDNKKELAEIDIETGEVRWNDLKIPDFGIDPRGYVFNESGSELIALNMESVTPKIYRLNMTTKEVKTIKLKHDGYPNFHEIIRLNDKYYTFYKYSTKKELAEIDIETGEVRWNDLKIPDFGIDPRGYVFNESGSELIALNMESVTPKVYRLNMTTKEVKTIKLKHDGYPNFHNIVAYEQ